MCGRGLRHPLRYALNEPTMTVDASTVNSAVKVARILGVACVLVVSACSEGASSTEATGVESAEVSMVTVSTVIPSTVIPSTVPPSTEPPITAPLLVEWAEPEVLPYADGSHDSWVATSTVREIAVYEDPNDLRPSQWFVSPTQFGGPRVFLIAGHQPGWLEVYLPVRPNGTTGWVRTVDVTVRANPYRVLVELDAGAVTVWHDAEVILQTPAATGRSDRPTPPGRFYLRDIIENPVANGPYGSHILALSGFSEALETFGGGLPALALHGTNQPDLVGAEVSSGCVRLLNGDIEFLAASLPLGTPVEIVS